MDSSQNYQINKEVLSNADVTTLKQRLINVALLAEKEGLCRHKSGNFSICVRDKKRILITPSGIDKALLKFDDIVVTDFDGNIIENINNNKASIELAMHIAIYKERQDVNAVVHTHSTYATAFAVKGIKIPPIVTEAIFYGEDVEVAEFAESGSIQLAENIKEPIKKADVCLLKNHGVITVSDTIEDALLKAFYVEHVAKVDIISKLI